MKTQTNTNYPGFIGRPGALHTELLGSKAIRLPFGFWGMDDDTIEIATGPCQIVGQVRVRKQKVRGSATANASKSNVWRTYASALSPEQQKAADLIANSTPLRKIL